MVIWTLEGIATEQKFYQSFLDFICSKNVIFHVIFKRVQIPISFYMFSKSKCSPFFGKKSCTDHAMHGKNKRQYFGFFRIVDLLTSAA